MKKSFRKKSIKKLFRKNNKSRKYKKGGIGAILGQSSTPGKAPSQIREEAALAAAEEEDRRFRLRLEPERIGREDKVGQYYRIYVNYIVKQLDKGNNMFLLSSGAHRSVLRVNRADLENGINCEEINYTKWDNYNPISVGIDLACTGSRKTSGCEGETVLTENFKGAISFWTRLTSIESITDWTEEDDRDKGRAHGVIRRRGLGFKSAEGDIKDYMDKTGKTSTKLKFFGPSMDQYFIGEYHIDDNNSRILSSRIVIRIPRSEDGINREFVHMWNPVMITQFFNKVGNPSDYYICTIKRKNDIPGREDDYYDNFWNYWLTEIWFPDSEGNFSLSN